MASSRMQAARDTSVAPAQFKAMIKREITGIARAERMGLFGVLPQRCWRAGLAHYSAGEQVERTRELFEKSADFRIRQIKESNYTFKGFPFQVYDLELLSAYHLVGRAPEVISAVRRCKYKSPPVPRLKGLFDQFSALLMGETVRQKADEMDDLQKRGKELATLPPVFKAVAGKKAKQFASALDECLQIFWAKEVRGASKRSDYVGSWSLLSAATSRLMGGVPPLSEKSLKFVPVDLI